MLTSCPHCQGSLDISADLFGHTVECPLCNGKFDVETPAGSADGEASDAKPVRTGWKEKDHANVNFLLALLIGSTVTILFLGAMFPLRGSIGAIFLDRGWVNWAETFLFFWGLAILGLKVKQNGHQEKATLLNLFPSTLGDKVNSLTVGGFIDNIYQIPTALRDTLIVNRIRKSLELFEIRNSNSEAESFLGSQSDIDSNRSAGSYSLVKVFLWAIPILGFIGTVMGLSTAVGSLSMGDNSDPAALKESINSLTGGLGVAFDTTLLGLILSMFLSFPLSAVQKKEDETLTLIDAFCSEKLLPKLDDTDIEAKNKGWLQNPDNIPELIKSLADAHETFLTNLNNSTVQLSESAKFMQNQISDNQRLVQEFHNALANNLGVAVSHVIETSSGMNKQLLDSQQQAVQSLSEAAVRVGKSSAEILNKSETKLQETFDHIATGIDLMNKSLKKLGEDQIPGTKKRGLFGFGG
jgi:hypothetical protein